MYTYTYIRHRAFFVMWGAWLFWPRVLCIVHCGLCVRSVQCIPCVLGFLENHQRGGSQDKKILKMKNAKFQIVLKMQKIGEVVTTSYIDPKGPPWSHVPFLP